MTRAFTGSLLPAGEPRPAPAGGTWDAIRVPAADAAMLQITYRAPAIRHPAGRTVTWLLPPAAAAGWDLPVVAELVPAGRPVLVPPAHWVGEAAGRPVWWTAPPEGGGLVPDAEELRAALGRLLILGRRTTGEERMGWGSW